MIVLDTNVLSNASRPKPEPAVVRWLDQVPQRESFTTAVAIAELRFGVARLPQGRKRAALHEYLEQGVVAAFEDRILDFDLAASAEFAMIVASREKAGRPMDAADGMIAAICRLHGAVLATDNMKDFEGTGVTLINPFRP
ncbi:type II toxin-antitoxin system VapC family toxin [Glycomyces sp. L485]|uniref:type II toxin-antitoxin system VapC family toxin n=1 Tax=Glycomyces sp. L485 TaxID=2909235 RepID=UPI001F4B3303|nr:type II toxin-antitoxin system VapC family toxin [Glycomyces sp. L485]MCH7231865.1 type II toxin-antitoxin system VapC family toxin [Glycomyces sp. L485]